MTDHNLDASSESQISASKPLKYPLRIAIFGANSVMARDFVSNSTRGLFDFVCFSRQPGEILTANSPHYEYDQFLTGGPYDGIVNFVGIGSPRKASVSSPDFGQVTRHYDSLVLGYLERNQEVPYVFISSGSVDSLIDRFGIHSRSDFERAQFRGSDLYAAAKLQSEISHRERPDLNIFDLRVFNYVSTRQSFDDGFLFTEIASALYRQSPLITHSLNLVRDFASATELTRVLEILISHRGNMPVDLYSREPISKFELLEDLQSKFGLKVVVDDDFQSTNPTGLKLEYTPQNRVLAALGYVPLNSSVENVATTLEGFGLGPKG